MLTILFVTVSSVYPQTLTVKSMKTLLESKAGYTSEDFEAVDAGEIVVKRLPTTQKREIAVCGLIKISFPYDVVLEGYRQTINQQKKETAKEFGRFQNPPAANDLNDLEFDEGDVNSLRKCRVGNCSWNLSAPMIARLQSEIDWKSPDKASKAAALIKSMLTEYLAGYMRQGDDALLEYNDKPSGLKLKDEYQTPHNALFFSEVFAPKFSEYFNDFPSGSLEGVENTASWAKIRVGLKDVVLITHNLNYEIERDGVSKAFMISKQVYANHYFDSTIGMTAVVGFTNSEGAHETYIVFVNHSSARALSGRIGKLVSGLVDSQAVDRVQEVLEDTKRNSEREFVNRYQPAPVEQEGIVTRTVKQPYFLWLVGLAGLAGAVFLFIKWRTRHP